MTEHSATPTPGDIQSYYRSRGWTGGANVTWHVDHVQPTAPGTGVIFVLEPTANQFSASHHANTTDSTPPP